MTVVVLKRLVEGYLEGAGGERVEQEEEEERHEQHGGEEEETRHDEGVMMGTVMKMVI